MAQVTGFQKVARFTEPSNIEDPNIRAWAHSLVRELNLSLNDKDIPPPQGVEVNRVLKATGQNVYAWISSDNPVSSGSADANKFLKTTAAQTFTWASVIDVDKVSSGSGDANKFFKTTGANTYAWTSVFEVSAGAGDTAKFLRATGAGAYAFTSINDTVVSAANQSEVEAAASASKAKYLNSHNIQFSPFTATGGLVCDVSARVCSSFGNISGVTRGARGKYTFTFSPAFASVGGIIAHPHVQMTSISTTMFNVKTAHAVSITVNSADVFTLKWLADPAQGDVTVSGADENNQRVQLVVFGNI